MPTSLATVILVVTAFAVAAVVLRVARVLVHRFLGTLEIVGHENQQALHGRAKQLTQALTLLAYGAAALVSASLALSRSGFSEPRWEPQLVARWFGNHGVMALIIIVGAAVLVRAANLAIEHLQFKLGRRHARTDLEWQRRAATLSRILTSTVTVSVAFVACLMVLRELDIDILPILTGAGIAGLAIGFGAQNLVRDVISGFFLILEDQVRIGDLARINGVAGTIEKINLRTIVLRDGDGGVQVFPNGTITALANLSKLFSYANVDIRVAYHEDWTRVVALLHEVGAAMAAEAEWQPRILAPLEVMGVESLNGGSARVRVRLKTQPLDQGSVANELRRRLMTTFVVRGVKPYSG